MKKTLNRNRWSEDEYNLLFTTMQNRSGKKGDALKEVANKLGRTFTAVSHYYYNHKNKWVPTRKTTISAHTAPGITQRKVTIHNGSSIHAKVIYSSSKVTVAQNGDEVIIIE